MTDCTKKYRRKVLGLICGSRQVRSEVAKQLDFCLQALQEEESGDYGTIVSLLGSPEELARDLMGSVSPEAHARYLRKRKWTQAIAALGAVALLLGFTGYLHRSRPIIVLTMQERLYASDENGLPVTDCRVAGYTEYLYPSDDNGLPAADYRIAGYTEYLYPSDDNGLPAADYRIAGYTECIYASADDSLPLTGPNFHTITTQEVS